MPALSTDYLTKVGDPGTATTLAAPGHLIGGTSITVVSTANYPTTTGCIFAIDTVTIVNGEEVRDAGSYTEWEGVVTGATTIESMVLRYGTDQNYPAGATTRVYIPVSSSRENRLIDGLLVSLDQDGTLKAGAVDNAACFGAGVVDNAALAAASVSNSKLITTAGDLGGAWKDWTPTLTNISLGNGTMVAKYTLIGKTVHYMLSIKFGSSTSVTSANSKFTLPLEVNSSWGTTGFTLGSAAYFIAGAERHAGIVVWQSSTEALFRRFTVSGTSILTATFTSTSPSTWQTNDTILVTGTYETV
jgi:hypothetical protein